jgi:hypothetical protein
MQGQSALDSDTFLTGCFSHGAVQDLFEIFFVEQGTRWQILRKLCVVRKSYIESFVQMPYVIVF